MYLIFHVCQSFNGVLRAPVLEFISCVSVTLNSVVLSAENVGDVAVLRHRKCDVTAVSDLFVSGNGISAVVTGVSVFVISIFAFVFRTWTFFHWNLSFCEWNLNFCLWIPMLESQLSSLELNFCHLNHSFSNWNFSFRHWNLFCRWNLNFFFSIGISGLWL